MRGWRTAAARSRRFLATQNRFAEGETVWLHWRAGRRTALRMNLRASFLLPARAVDGAVLRRSARHRLRLQLAHARRLRRRRAALDPRKLHAPRRSALSRHPLALRLDRARSRPLSARCSGFPLALFIARAGRRKNLYLQLVLLPFWTSFLVRTYAWLFILRDTGLINTVLLRLHLITRPCSCSITTARCCSGWSTTSCRSSCCRCTPRSNVWTPHCSKPRPIWARARLRHSGA